MGLMIVFEWVVRIVLVQALALLSQDQGWTLVHLVHGVINFVFMHYVSGTSMELVDIGEFSTFTWWEQLDDGVQWTPARKAVMLIEIVLFLFTSYLTDYHPGHLLVNLAVFLLVMVPKLPQSHRLRVVSSDEEEEE
jgi:MFS superfamily sulfate permease-like transporter